MLKIQDVGPIGMRTVHGFGHHSDGTPVYEWQEPEYPASPEGQELRRIRVHVVGAGVREASRRLGISAMEYSALERGSAVTDWEAAKRLLVEGT